VPGDALTVAAGAAPRLQAEFLNIRHLRINEIESKGTIAQGLGADPPIASDFRGDKIAGGEGRLCVLICDRSMLFR
jgi:hypothetical protein